MIAMFLIASIFLFIAGSFIAARTASAQKTYSLILQENPAPANTPYSQPGEAGETVAEPESAEPAEPVKEEPRLPVSVTDVYLSGNKDLSPEAAARTSVAVGDTVEFRVENLQQLVNDSLCVNSAGESLPGCEPKELRIFLDGVMLPGIKADNLELTQGLVKFHLERIKDGGERAGNAEQWKKLLSTPLVARDFFKRQMEASVGLENGIQVPGKPVLLVRVQQWMFWVWMGVLLALLAGLVILARNTDILRDQGAPPPEEGKRKPYSLAKCQAAFWFFLTITSFCFIFMIMSSFDSLTEGVLGLLGISAGTAVGGAVIDKSSEDATQKKLDETQAENENLASDVNQIEVEHAAALAEPFGSAGEPEKAAGTMVLQPLKAMRAQSLERQYNIKVKRMQALQQRQEVLTEAVSPRASQGFRKDLLSDEQGSIGFHRLQLVAWTLVLGGIFVYTVWRSLSMPDFSAMLVTLQGISGATYLGFKFPENQV